MLSVPSDCPSLVPPDSCPAGAEALHKVWSGDHIDQSRWHLLLETKPEKSTELPSLMSDQSPSYAYLIRLGWPSMSHDHLINKELCQSCSLLQCHQGTLCLSSLPCTMYCTDVGLIKVEIWTWYFEILLVYDANKAQKREWNLGGFGQIGKKYSGCILTILEEKDKDTI